MFTGIIEDMGKVVTVGSGTLSIDTRLEDLQIGDSVAVNGICLTVSSILRRDKLARPTFDFAPETAAVTTIGGLRPGSAVNMERALRADGRFGGHLMTGHIEGTSRLRKRRREGNAHLFTFQSVPHLERYIVRKGSIGVDGISLTVAECRNGHFSVSVVPYTLEQTNLRDMVVDQRVNIEPDLLAKYVESVLPAAVEKRPVTEESLRQNGFIK